MKELNDKKCEKEFLLYNFIVSKCQNMSYHWECRKNFIKLFADSAFSFLGIGPKVSKYVASYFIGLSKGLQNLFKYTEAVSNLS